MTFKGDISMFHAKKDDARNILEEVKHELTERAARYGKLSEVFAEPAKQRYGEIEQELINLLDYIQELEK